MEIHGAFSFYNFGLSFKTLIENAYVKKEEK